MGKKPVIPRGCQSCWDKSHQAAKDLVKVDEPVDSKKKT